MISTSYELYTTTLEIVLQQNKKHEHSKDTDYTCTIYMYLLNVEILTDNLCGFFLVRPKEVSS